MNLAAMITFKKINERSERVILEYVYFASCVWSQVLTLYNLSIFIIYIYIYIYIYI